MSQKEIVTLRSARANLTSSLAERFPNLEPKERGIVEARMLNYLAEGIRNGADVGLIIDTGESFDVRALRLVEKPVQYLEPKNRRQR